MSTDSQLEKKESSSTPTPETAPPPGPPPPPDGGLTAWLQVAGGFVLFFNTWGMISTFGVFQTYYESGELFSASSSAISWIGSIQSFLLQLTGLIAGPIYDRGYLRALLVTGSFLVVFGLMMLSLCTEYWQAVLAQAICIGLGSGLLFVPTVSLIPTWFSSHMALAIGIASSGSGLGGVIYPVVLSSLIPKIGFPWAVRVIGFICLALFIVPVAGMKTRIRAPKPRAMLDWAAFTDGPWITFTFGVLLVFIANSVAIFYISYYPAAQGFTGPSLSFYMAAIFNVGSIFGRIIPNAIADRIGPFNTMIPLTVLLGVTMMCLLAVVNAAGMIVEALVVGFFSGVVIALPPIIFRILTENKSMIGTRMGQGFAIAGIGLLIGGPGAGGVLAAGGDGEENWVGLWCFGGGCAIAAGLVYTGVRVAKYGFSPSTKA